VLLIACGNVAALLFLRGLGRQQEYAVRAALGVGRAGLFRQASTESLLLALAGGALGAGLAFGAVRAFQLIGGHAIPRLDAVTTGWPVLLFGLGLALIAATLAGLFPAWRASRLDPNEVLKGAGPKSTVGRSERRLLRAVTMAQTALTLVLLVGAGLLIRTMINIANAPSGYDTSRILTMSVTSVQMSGGDFHRLALERVQALPGVQHAAYAWGVPLTGNNWPMRVIIEGQPVPASASEATELPLRSITSGYFEMLGLPLIEGRDFRSNDNDDARPVAIVNQAFADRYFPDTATLGKKVWLRGPNEPHNTIVGVVANGRTDDLTRRATPEIYGSFWQYAAYSKHLLIRTEAEPLSMASAVQSALRAGQPLRRRRAHQDLRTDPRRLTRWPHLRHAASDRLRGGGLPANARRHLRRPLALGGLAPARDRDPYGRRRGAPRHPESRILRRLPPHRRWRRRGTGRCASAFARAAIVPL
jgi:putative ABC transport system permease protein